MSTDTEQDAVFVGGPRDGTVFHSYQVPLVELEIEGVIHRYVRTTERRDRDGRSYLAYNYDGAVDPTRARSGAEPS